MRFSPRLLILVPIAGALFSLGQIQSHISYAQNPVAAPDPLARLPLPPSQHGGTLGGPLQTGGTKAPATSKTPASPFAPRPTVAARPAPTPTPAPAPEPRSAIRVGISTTGGPLQLWVPEGAVLRDPEQPGRAQRVPANATLLFGSGAPKSEKVGAQTFRGAVSVQVGGRTSFGWSKIAVSPLGAGFGRATSNGNAARYGRPYRGSFEVFAQRAAEANHRKGPLALVNVVGLEDYLKGVVPWEMSPAAPNEALKAQAICARTKTLDFKQSGRFASGGFDVCDYDACQGYPGTENEKLATTSAVEATSGLALFYGGKPIDAVYSTNSGGVTAAARDVWRGDVPYLQSVRDFAVNSPLETLFQGAMSEGKWAQFVSQPFASYARPDGVAQTRYEARKYRWTQFVSQSEASTAFAAQGISRVLSIEVETRTPSGRVRRVKVTGVDAARLKTMPLALATATPNAGAVLNPAPVVAPEMPQKSVVLESDGPIRAMFSKRLGSTTALPSSLFVVTPQTSANGEVVGWNFAGAGWGHGVGMCQRGAQNHARDGWDARRILNWYYRGVDIRAVS